jgi:putative ABC transport system permease protein
VSKLSRFVNLWRQPAVDRELDDELAFHFEMRVEKNLRNGMDRSQAEADAKRHLGAPLRAKEGMREARVMVWLESLGADLGHGARLLRRRPGLSVLAILTLSLGIGANAAIFTLLNALLLQPLPYHDPSRLMAIVDRFTRVGASGSPTIPEIIDLRERSHAFASVAFFDTRDFRMTGGDEPSRVFTARVSASLFPTLNVQPALGRLFEDTDNLAGHWNVVLLADGLWRRNFGADPAVVGRTLMVNGSPHTVVGVLPPGFSVDYPALSGPEAIEMYVPFQMYEAYTSRNDQFVNVRRVTTIARLRDGVTREQASAELQTVSQGIEAEHPELYRRAGESVGFRLDVEGLHEAVTKGSRSILMFLFGAVALVLLIACVNTGQFLLAQSLDREAEVAVRASLGAGRGRLFRQFLVECSVLVCAGGALGLIQALWLVQILVAMIPGRTPLLAIVGVDRTVLAFTAGLSFLSSLGVGVLPALYFSRTNPAGRLTTRSAGPAGNRSRHLLVAVEVALAVVLLAAAGLLLQGVHRLQNADRGFSSDDVTVMQIRSTAAQSTKPIPSIVFQHYVDHIAAIPGVEAVAVATPLPLRNPPVANFVIEGRASDLASIERQPASYQIVSADYFRALRIPLRQGRLISNDDLIGRPRVAVINDTMARRHWPDQSPLGRQIRVGASTMTVVGVVGDVQATPLETKPGPQIYVSNLQQFEPNMNVVVRASAGSAMTAEAIKKAIWSVSADQPVFNIQPMSQLISTSLAEQRYIAMLLVTFAGLALFMSATGVYTVVAYLVARRTHEIAVRLAVGARARDIVRLISGQTLRWTMAGLAFGVAATVASSGVMRAALRGVSELDAPTMAALVAFYLVVAGCAVCVPVARALRFLDPAAALRAE